MGETCRACGAPIVWGRTPAGKAIPLDAEPNDKGNVNLRSDGTVEVFGAATAQMMRIGGVKLYISHFVTCSDPKRFRRK